MADKTYDELRREIALQLKQRERDMAMGEGAIEPPQPLDPRSMRPKEPGDPGPPLQSPVPSKQKPSKVGTYDPALGYIPDPSLDEAANKARAEEMSSAYKTLESETPVTEKVKETGRAALAIASGGATEAVSDAVVGAPAQAGSEVQGKSLETMTPEGIADLMVRAGIIPPEQQQAAYAVIKPHWQPGTRTEAQGSTGKDPNAVRAAMELQGVSEQAQAKGLQQTQAADKTQYELALKVQQNEMNAIKAFKRDHDNIQARYEGERQAQFERMNAIQKAMDEVPDAPRTIRAKMDQSGFSDKAALGLAAAFSVLGGATLRDGGRSVQTFLGNVQANIDRNVQKEADEFARLGERAKMSNNIYANLRTALQDDTQAMNVTKALYYDAAANAVQQIATQYKMDTQSPQIQSLLAHLAEQRQKLILDTAQTMQTQLSQTDKFNPGGVVQVGGAAAKKNEYKSSDLDKDANEYSKELEKRGFNMGERALGLYQKAIETMKQGGFRNNEAFKSAFIALSDPKASPAKQAAVQILLDDKQRAALSLIVAANKEGLKDSSGKSVTANELVRDVLEKGDYSIESLDRARQVIAANREQIQNAAAGGFDPRVVDRYHARKDLAGVTRQFAGIATGARQPIDTKDIAQKVEGRLAQ